MATVTFTRTFTSGTFAGLSMNDSLRCVDRAHAEMWVAGVMANIARGKLNYTLSNVQIAA